MIEMLKKKKKDSLVERVWLLPHLAQLRVAQLINMLEKVACYWKRYTTLKSSELLSQYWKM